MFDAGTDTIIENPAALEAEASGTPKLSKEEPRSAVSQEDSASPESPTSATFSALVGTPPGMEEFELESPTPPRTPPPPFHRNYLIIGMGALGLGIVGVAIWLVYEAVTRE
ncbi:hypothetical protein TNCT_526991 [Trichonephila clavata]|uniref:Uncharacterized protein n=1 Tax=Trichonephila clavata TaxID=2740835 RepID=A0A8X6M200_TRICU|nr:hypothetical protein TNCT_526991 [Trichonephila clavata]